MIQVAARRPATWLRKWSVRPIRNEPRSLRIDVPVPEAALPMSEETLRHHQMSWSLARVMAT